MYNIWDMIYHRHLAQALACLEVSDAVSTWSACPFISDFNFSSTFSVFVAAWCWGFAPLSFLFVSLVLVHITTLKQFYWSHGHPRAFLKNLYPVMPIKFNQYQFFHHQTSPTTSMQVTTSQTPSWHTISTYVIGTWRTSTNSSSTTTTTSPFHKKFLLIEINKHNQF